MKKKLRSKWGPGAHRGDADPEPVERTYFKRIPNGAPRLVTESLSVIEFKRTFREPAGWRHGARISR